MLSDQGIIRQVNPPGSEIFATPIQNLIGQPLDQFLPKLARQPSQWANSSEQTIEVRQQKGILDVSISSPSPQSSLE